MRTSRLTVLVVLAAVLPAIVGGPAWARGAEPRTVHGIGQQQGELQGSDTVAQDGFGVSVAISGAAVVAGAPGYAKSAGRAYVFEKSGDAWKQAAELKGSDTAASDYFGYSVVIAGTTVVVGSPGYAKDAGRVYVFTKAGASWKQTAELKGSDTAADDGFGYAVALSGTTAAVGAPVYTKNAGRAYVFTDTPSGWKQAAELKGSDTVGEDGFGVAIAVSGATAVVGADGHAKGAGRAYVFTNSVGGWKQSAELKGADTVADDGFGISVVLSGTTLMIGAPDHAKLAGRAYVFTGAAGTWKQVGELKGADTVANDGFGVSVALSGTTAVVSAPDRASDAGRAYVFTA